MIDPFSKTKFYPDLHLETWRPSGVLDNLLLTQIASYIGFEEKILDEPFDRLIDFTELTAIHLSFAELADFACLRREAYAGRPPVKSAIVATSAAAFAVTGMFMALMESSPIKVLVFRDLDSAAGWLGVPVESLRENS